MNEKMSYNRARLLLGMSSVGTWVLLALLLKPFNLEPFHLLALYLAISLPFDLLGGQVLPRWFSQGTMPLGAWLAVYLRSLLLHTGVLVGAAASLKWASQYGALLPAAIIVMLLLVTGQSAFARLGGTMRFSERSCFEGKDTVIAECSQEGFTGGVSGLPRSELILLPAHWSDEVRKVAICRRKLAIGSGCRNLGLLVGISWSAIGLLLLAPKGALSSYQLTQLSLSMTLWSFFGLLTLPSLARAGVKWMDAKTLRWLGWPAFQIYLDAMTDETEDAKPISEPVFYPIPSRKSRLENLQSRQRSRVIRPWYPARMALYLSVGSLGLLSRAVHCNAGRPALWFLPPCD